MEKNPGKSVLEAVSRLVNQKGVSYLTLSNVADEAGISKGGLLHYFPNKNALIEAAVNDVLENYTKNFEEKIKNDRDPGRTLRAYIDGSLNEPEQISAGLLAAVATDPKLLSPFQEHYREWQQRVEEDGVEPVMATIVRLAVDGLWFCDMFGLAPLDEDLRNQVLDELVKITKSKQ